MAKPNYQFEKRQRDLAKKRKKEEKLQKKIANTQNQPQENPEAPVSDEAKPAE